MSNVQPYPSRFNLMTGDTKASELLDEIITNYCPKSWYHFLHHIIHYKHINGKQYTFETFDKFFKKFKSSLGNQQNHDKYRKNNIYYIRVWLLHAKSYINKYKSNYKSIGKSKNFQNRLSKKAALKQISQIYQELYKYHIGTNFSEFYIEWANYYLSRRKYEKAKHKIKIGIKYPVNDPDKLNEYYTKITSSSQSPPSPPSQSMIASVDSSDLSTSSDSIFDQDSESENDEDVTLKHHNNMDVDEEQIDKKPAIIPVGGLLSGLPQRVAPNDDEDDSEEFDDEQSQELIQCKEGEQDHEINQDIEGENDGDDEDEEDDEAFLNDYQHHISNKLSSSLPQITENHELSPEKPHGLSIRTTPFPMNNTYHSNENNQAKQRRPSTNTTNTHNVSVKFPHKRLVPFTPNTLIRNMSNNKPFSFANRGHNKRDKEIETKTNSTSIQQKENISKSNSPQIITKEKKPTPFSRHKSLNHLHPKLHENRSTAKSRRRGSEPPTPPSWNTQNKFNKVTKSPTDRKLALLRNSKSLSKSMSPTHSNNNHGKWNNNNNHNIYQNNELPQHQAHHIKQSQHLSSRQPNHHQNHKNVNMNSSNTSQSSQNTQPSQRRLHETHSHNHNNYRLYDHHNNNHPPSMIPKQSHPHHTQNHHNQHQSRSNQPSQHRSSHHAQQRIQKPHKSSSSAMNVLTLNGRSMIQLKRIGRGGSSEVYQVITKDTHEILALKKITVSNSLDPNAKKDPMENFQNEIELLQKLKNKPYCIQMIDFEILNDSRNNRTKIYMLFECGEIDLSHLLKSEINGYFQSMNTIQHYWEQMLLAVDTIHGLKIVHGDLKPANFLMVKGKLKLIDFGIAKQIKSNETTHIARDSQIGTLNYISPEALIGTDQNGDCYKLSRAADVWSLGCILHQMCFGFTPFTHLQFAQKLQAIVAGSCQQHIKMHENRFVNDVIKRCLLREPKKRITILQLIGHMLLQR